MESILWDQRASNGAESGRAVGRLSHSVSLKLHENGLAAEGLAGGGIVADAGIPACPGTRVSGGELLCAWLLLPAPRAAFAGSALPDRLGVLLHRAGLLTYGAAAGLVAAASLAVAMP